MSNPIQNRAHYPALIIGTGIAGLTTAFSLARSGVKVLLVTKTEDPAEPSAPVPVRLCRWTSRQTPAARSIATSSPSR